MKLFIQIHVQGQSENVLPAVMVEYKDSEDKDKLVDLRQYLVANQIIDSSDQFKFKNAVVHQSQESSTKITEIAENKEGDGAYRIFILRQEKRIRAELDKNFKAPDIKSPDLPKDESSHVDLTRRGKDSSDTKGGEKGSYDLLDDKEKNLLLTRSNVFRGILYKNGNITWSFRKGVSAGSTPWEKVLYRVPQETYINDELFTFDKREVDIHKVISGSISGGYSGVGWGIEAEVSGGWSNKKHESSSTMYAYSEIVVPKVEFRLNLGQEDLIQQFQDSMKKFEGINGEEFDHYILLRELFEEWGAFFPLEFVIGGKLFSTDTTIVKSDTEASAFQANVRTAIKGVFWNVNVAAKYESSSTNAHAEQSKTAFLQAVGGDPGLVNDPPKWVASLGSFINWRTCKIASLKPVYEYASKEAQEGIYNTFCQWADYWKRDPLMLDFDAYVQPLTLKFGLYEI